ncbi:hypothetical protein [Arenimonas composti]|uniref:hypothetical protein n=1 Tax=Arenimonas composti TaxID=370776 RepID=UPI0012E03A4E|nr:hypothetical protein [Arenimonas composti]
MAFIDGLMKSIDPELVPGSVWDSFDEQCRQLKSNIEAYVSTLDIGYLRNANGHADNLLTYVRPYMVAGGRTSKALRDAAVSYSTTMSAHLETFKKLAREALEEIRKISGDASAASQVTAKVAAEVKSLQVELFGEDDASGVREQILSAQELAKKSADELSSLHSKFLVGSDGKPALKTSIVEAYEAAKKDRQRLSELLSKAESSLERLGNFHHEVFGEPDEEGTYTGGLAKEIQVQRANLVQLQADHAEKYLALTDEINSLLPGATSAGLASSYRQIKDSFNRQIRFAGAAFYVSVGLLAAMSLLTVFDWTEGWFVLRAAGDWKQVLNGLAQKLPFYGAIVWLAYYVSKRRSEYQRLQQEYAHKEAVASSYENFRKQAEAIGGKDSALLTALLAKAIEAMAHNASQTLDGAHGDKMPSLDVVEKAVDRLASVGERLRGLRPA